MAKQESLRTSECPVARTLESIGERLSLIHILMAITAIQTALITTSPNH